MKLFPFIVVRIGGNSIERLKKLNIEIGSSYGNLHAEKAVIKQDITESLFKEISAISDAKKQNRILNIKRDIYNERDIKRSNPTELENLLSKETLEKITNLERIKFEIEDESRELKNKYDVLLREKSNHLKELSSDSKFLNGLIFSSRSLYGNVKDYQNQNDDYNKNTKRTELSIIKYLTRSYAKTTPFSTFTSLGYCILSNNTNGLTFEATCNEGFSTFSTIRINNSLYSFIRNSIYRIKELYTHIDIRLNPTIREKNGYYKFLINFNNLESFQKLIVNPVTEYLYNKLKNIGRISFKDFVKNIKEEDIFDAAEDDIENYIYGLIEYGFYEFDMGISGYDIDWAGKLINHFRNTKTGTKSEIEIISLLNFMIEKIPELQNCDCEEKIKIIDACHRKFIDFKSLLESALHPNTRQDIEENKYNATIEDTAGSGNELSDESSEVVKNVSAYAYDLKPETMYFEDIAVKECFSAKLSTINEIMKLVTLFLGYFRFFNSRLETHHYFLAFYRKHFGEKESVPMLEYYELYRNQKKLANEYSKRGRDKENIDDIPYGLSMQEANEFEMEMSDSIAVNYGSKRNNYIEIIAGLIFDQNISIEDEIIISEKLISDAYQKAGISIDKTFNTSTGCLIQLYDSYSSDKTFITRGVLDIAFPGYGKMSSRFLHLFPEEVRKETINWNSRQEGSAIFAENHDSGIMNYNLHPSLMKHEISIPGGNFTVEDENRVLISDLHVVPLEEEGLLTLHDISRDKRVYTFDLGFQGYLGRSELFKFLDMFTVSEFYYFLPLLKKIDDSFPKTEVFTNGMRAEIRIIPRIVFENRIVIKRKEWIIPKNILPMRNSGEKEADYFDKVQRWRFDLSIPNEVFIRVTDKTPSAKESAKNPNFSKDDYKPQYIDFRNPFLVRLFEKLIHKIADKITITEMLPNTDVMYRLKGERYATEFLIQNYSE